MNCIDEEIFTSVQRASHARAAAGLARHAFRTFADEALRLAPIAGLPDNVSKIEQL